MRLLLKKMPELIADPVAIIESETRPHDSVVAIVSGEVMGRQVMAAVEIGGVGKMNGKKFDVNAINSVYGRKNAVTKLLTNALQKQNASKAGVYYLKKSEARSLFARAGVQFPGSTMQDGLNHSIFDAGASVNKKFLDQTETRQFIRWFGKSAVVDSAGKPLVMYHGTRPENGNFTVFDYDRAVKKGGLGLQALGKGNYFTAKKLTGTERYGSRIIQAYLSIQNPYRFYGGQSLAEKLASEMNVDQTTLNGAGIQTLLKEKGYDGVIQYGKNGEIELAVTFSSNQSKSTENIGTFFPQNQDILYSLKSEDISQDVSEDAALSIQMKTDADAKAAAELFYRLRYEAGKEGTAGAAWLGRTGEIADKLLKETGSTYGRNKLIQDLNRLYCCSKQIRRATSPSWVSNPSSAN